MRITLFTVMFAVSTLLAGCAADKSTVARDDAGCPMAQSDCQNSQGTCPKAATCPKASTCPKAKEGCPKAQGTCPKAKGECPKAKGECPKAQGTCPKAQGTCPKTQGTCPKAKCGEKGCCPDCKCVCCSGKVLRHVVLFKFKDNTTPEQIKTVIDAFKALPEKIPTIKGFEWGTNVSPENRAQGLTHAITLTFTSEADRDAYLPHPAHKEFGKIAGPYLDKITVVDYWAQK